MSLPSTFCCYPRYSEESSHTSVRLGVMNECKTKQSNKLPQPANNSLIKTKMDKLHVEEKEEEGGNSLPIMNINDLNYDSLVYLFSSNMPLQELPSLRCVCHHWHKLIDSYLGRCHTLKLFSSIDHVQDYGDDLFEHGLERGFPRFALRSDGSDDLVFTLKSDARAALVSDQFPKVRHLVAHLSKSDYDHFHVLIRAWNKTLESVSLFGDIPTHSSHEQIFNAINALPKLRSLELMIPLAGELRLPNVLPQLKVFAYCGQDASILDKLGNALHLKQLTLSVTTVQMWEEVFARKPNFGQSIEMLNLNDVNEPIMRVICQPGRFPALKVLELGTIGVSSSNASKHFVIYSRI